MKGHSLRLVLGVLGIHMDGTVEVCTSVRRWCEIQVRMNARSEVEYQLLTGRWMKCSMAIDGEVLGVQRRLRFNSSHTSLVIDVVAWSVRAASVVCGMLGNMVSRSTRMSS